MIPGAPEPERGAGAATRSVQGEHTGVAAHPILFAWGPAVAWALAVFALSSIPRLSLPEAGGLPVDKIGHFGEYLLLGALLARATRISGWRVPRAAAAVIGILFAVMDELHQALIPGRFADPRDLAADGLGVVLGVLVLLGAVERLGGRGAPGAPSRPLTHENPHGGLPRTGHFR